VCWKMDIRKTREDLEEEESARSIRNLEESDMLQEHDRGHPSDPWKDEACKILKNLPTEDNLLLTNGKELTRIYPSTCDKQQKILLHRNNARAEGRSTREGCDRWREMQ
jgi:hypothetical protein